MLNMLTEPLIRMATAGGGTQSASLPEVYAALMADEAEAFPALRPHQWHAWHAFLVQLGAMAMHRAGISESPADAADWVDLIRGLTVDFPDDEPWQLVVDDITKPAFMQPPARSADNLAEYLYKRAKGKHEARNGEKEAVTTPDELDMLVTSKNHDLKSTVVSEARTDDWIFALITLQTMEGYGGAGNYGISRMPSGYGNRPAFSITPSARHGGHIRRDIEALLQHRQAILDEYPVINTGIGLLWVRPWDGTKAETVLINQMEPFYIEICRRVRLRIQDGELEAVRANSLDRRIADVKGLTGDPWTPVSNNVNPRGTPPAFLGLRKFGYERVVDGLFSPDWKEPYLLRLTLNDRRHDGPMQLVARGMVRGEGGTAGYHQRIIRLRPKTIQRFGQPGGRQVIEDISRERIVDVRNVQRILRHAIATFAAHGDSRRGEHRNGNPSPNDLANPWTSRLDEIVDYRFFDDLQTELEVDEVDERKHIRKAWLEGFVIASAGTVLRDSWDSLPCPDSQKLRASATSQNIFYGRIYREFNVQLDQLQEA